MADKLHIPGPDEHDDFSELDMSIVWGWAVCMLLCIALFLFFRGRRPEPEPPRPDDPVKARQVELLSRPEVERRGFVGVDFGQEDAVAVFRHGPRQAAEAACEGYAAQLEDGSLTHTLQLELLKAVDRRAEHAPWTCLLRRFFDKELSADLELFGEVAEFWTEMQRFEAAPAITASALDDFRRSRQRPEHPDFYSWLRLCGLHPDYAASPSCLAILHQLSPAQGRDALDAVEQHFAERAPERLRADMNLVTAGLGELARSGQPEAFQIEQTAAIPDYDAALRVGATFVLCRIAHSPDDAVARAAALQLAEAATVAARATDENLLTRWRESCVLAFSAGGDNEDTADPDAHGSAQPQRAAALAVWNGDDEQRPDYRLAWAVERGDCPGYEGRPSWYCGVDKWQGDDQALDLALMGFFTETRFVEWAE